MSKIPAIGLYLAAASLFATPALSDSCPPQQQVHQYIRTHYARNATRTTSRIAYRRAHTRRHYVMMEEPYYETYDQYYDVSGPHWHSQLGWWEWHPSDDDYL